MARYLVLLAAVVLTTLKGTAEAASACAPDCSSASEGESVAVPWDCTKYSVCSKIEENNPDLWPSDPKQCPSSMVFDGAQCTTYSPETSTCINTCSPCEALWSSPGDVTPVPSNCSLFNVCLQGEVLLETSCSKETPYYDYRSGMCQTDNKKCFNFCDICQYYCIDGEDPNVPDPYNCTSFYQCNPPNSVHFECPTGENFDVVNRVCSSTAPCNQTCTPSTNKVLLLQN